MKSSKEQCIARLTFNLTFGKIKFVALPLVEYLCILEDFLKWDSTWSFAMINVQNMVDLMLFNPIFNFQQTQFLKIFTTIVGPGLKFQ